MVHISLQTTAMSNLKRTSNVNQEHRPKIEHVFAKMIPINVYFLIQY